MARKCPAGASPSKAVGRYRVQGLERLRAKRNGINEGFHQSAFLVPEFWQVAPNNLGSHLPPANEILLLGFPRGATTTPPRDGSWELNVNPKTITSLVLTRDNGNVGFT